MPFVPRKNSTISTSYYNELGEPESYKEAMAALGMLQSKPKESADPNNLKDTWKYLYRSGITARDIDTLSVIHVAGTKGKSSACAICESILHSFGCKTGFFSSPHFISVTERYHINGRPITEKYFSKVFWKLYNTLDKYKEHAADLPTYFKFLTILGLHIFFDSNVDVAIIETGVGGLYDSTNIVRNVQTIGITSIGLDHSDVLGKSFEEVAAHKAGIIKPNANVFLAPVDYRVYDIFNAQAHERNANLFIIPDMSEYAFKKIPKQLSSRDQLQNINSSLGIQLAYDWLRRYRSNKLKNFKSGIVLDTSPEVVKGIESCRWPGMSHIVQVGNKTVYLNGADNINSLRTCIDWFKNLTDSSNKYRCLVFNPMPNTDVKVALLAIGNNINLEMALFVPDIHYHNKERHLDCEHTWQSSTLQIDMAEACSKFWSKISNMPPMKVKHFTSVLDAFLYLDKFYPDVEFDILVTGSMSVIGATRRALDRYRILII
ncbi:unnamed protein product [Hermetia illucens]|uniref:tetrahydrofolate synthase n=2 Tax=Hermetia illucens TaxID=343691 RepID=A0A7R8UUA9_HERIL|nr:unnamed protein product [Hermetia illucens]